MYNLIRGEDSKEYYIIIKKVSKDMKEYLNINCEDIVSEFMEFIKMNNIETLRSKEEYGIEVILIGVMWNEYISNAIKNKRVPISLCNKLSDLRNKSKRFKKNIDLIRGVINSRLLIRKGDNNIQIEKKEFSLLLKWMGAVGDFKEEIIRMKNWEIFFENNSEKAFKKVIVIANNTIEYLYKVSDYSIGSYIQGLEKFLSNYKNDHKNKEDIIYCGKRKIHYYFNMVSAEIMNEAYEKSFRSAKEKLVFLPGCIRQVKNVCKGIKTENGYKCIGCFKDCNGNKIRSIGEKEGFKTYIIPRETDLRIGNENESKSIGIIGIACITNLISGGFKAIRLGFIPQCILLDYCGCNHWYKDKRMTSINYKVLKEKVK